MWSYAELSAFVVAQSEQIARKREAAPFSKGFRRWIRSGRAGSPLRERSNAERSRPSRIVNARQDCRRRVRAVATRSCSSRRLSSVRPSFPSSRAIVIKFNVENGLCVGCEPRIQGRHVEQTSNALGACASQLGLRAKAIGHVLDYQHGLSFMRCAELLGLLGVKITAGALVHADETATATDLDVTYTAILAGINRSSAVTMDETGWRNGGLSACLWTATTGTLTAYTTRKDAGSPRAVKERTFLDPKGTFGFLDRSTRHETHHHATCPTFSRAGNGGPCPARAHCIGSGRSRAHVTEAGAGGTELENPAPLVVVTNNPAAANKKVAAKH